MARTRKKQENINFLKTLLRKAYREGEFLLPTDNTPAKSLKTFLIRLKAEVMPELDRDERERLRKVKIVVHDNKTLKLYLKVDDLSDRFNVLAQDVLTHEPEKITDFFNK